MSKGGANSISLGIESTPPNDDPNPFISTFFFPIDFFGKSAKKFFVDFISVFPHPPPLKLKQIDRESCIPRSTFNCIAAAHSLRMIA